MFYAVFFPEVMHTSNFQMFRRPDDVNASQVEFIVSGLQFIYGTITLKYIGMHSRKTQSKGAAVIKA